jgi:hypothetical protein
MWYEHFIVFVIFVVVDETISRKVVDILVSIAPDISPVCIDQQEWSEGTNCGMFNAVYGTMVAALLYYKKFVKSLTKLGWEFRFLVPISGTPIGSGIPDPFPIRKILVGKILIEFRC